jgi:hypothetical protein
MSYDRFASPQGSPFDMEAVYQFWDATLSRVKV